MKEVSWVHRFLQDSLLDGEMSPSSSHSKLRLLQSGSPPPPLPSPPPGDFTFVMIKQWGCLCLRTKYWTMLKISKMLGFKSSRLSSKATYLHLIVQCAIFVEFKEETGTSIGYISDCSFLCCSLLFCSSSPSWIYQWIIVACEYKPGHLVHTFFFCLLIWICELWLNLAKGSRAPGFLQNMAEWCARWQLINCELINNLSNNLQIMESWIDFNFNLWTDGTFIIFC